MFALSPVSPDTPPPAYSEVVRPEFEIYPSNNMSYVSQLSVRQNNTEGESFCSLRYTASSGSAEIPVYITPPRPAQPPAPASPRSARSIPRHLNSPQLSSVPTPTRNTVLRAINSRSLLRSVVTQSPAQQSAPGLHLIRPRAMVTPRRPVRAPRDLVTIEELPDSGTVSSSGSTTPTSPTTSPRPSYQPVLTGVKRTRSEAQLSPPSEDLASALDLATTTTGPSIPGLLPVRTPQLHPPVPAALTTGLTTDLMNLAMISSTTVMGSLTSEYLDTAGAVNIPPRPWLRPRRAGQQSGYEADSSLNTSPPLRDDFKVKRPKEDY